MTIKDFKVGEPAYVLTENRGRNAGFSLKTATVKAIGRKYVTLDNDVRYEKNDAYANDALTENRSWGERTLLFLTEEDAKGYEKKKEIESWMMRNANQMWRRLSLHQLSQIYEIMNGE